MEVLNHLLSGHSRLVLAVLGDGGITLGVGGRVVEVGQEVVANGLGAGAGKLDSGHILLGGAEENQAELKGVVVLRVDEVGVLGGAGVLVDGACPMAEVAAKQLAGLGGAGSHLIGQGQEEAVIEAADVLHRFSVDHVAVADVGVSAAGIVDLQLVLVHQSLDGQGLLAQGVHAVEDRRLILDIDGAITRRDEAHGGQLDAGLDGAKRRLKLDAVGVRIHLVRAVPVIVLEVIRFHAMSVEVAEPGRTPAATVEIDFHSRRRSAALTSADRIQHCNNPFQSRFLLWAGGPCDGIIIAHGKPYVKPFFQVFQKKFFSRNSLFCVYIEARFFKTRKICFDQVNFRQWFLCSFLCWWMLLGFEYGIIGNGIKGKIWDLKFCLARLKFCAHFVDQTKK